VNDALKIKRPRPVLPGWTNDIRRDFHVCAPVPFGGMAFCRAHPPAPAEDGDSAGTGTRFTIDGSAALEDRLERICDQVRRKATAQIPRKQLAAIVLGGGYGRAEGGVLRTEAGDQPYNDLEFYVFVRGNRLWQQHRYGRKLHDLGAHLSAEAGVQIEFKIDCADRWRRSPVSMFSYDLVSGHRMVFGDESVFMGCGHHLDAAAIPLSEATRLMFNRCSGLLLARELLQQGALTSDEADFVGRNLAKMQLALGDAVLTAFGQYHWSTRERHRRLSAFAAEELHPWLPEIQAHHGAGLVFKLHPRRASKPMHEFDLEHRRLTELAMQLWLWLEGRRLKQRFLSASDYALSDVDKCPGTSAWRNYCLNLRTFGPKATLEALSCRYPRERLFNALALLLWDAEEAARPPFIRWLQEELQTDAPDRAGLVNVFKRIWPCYG
jgi:hypothetical protein